MATYVNDLRLKEIATGDESGTWGVSTNTNLELIAEGFSYATVDPFDTDADKTETMADGATDPIRSLYLKVTSTATLTATRTLTLAPNTVSKVWIIENATTGSQSINISQGSGANVTIPNGDVKIVYTDGAGATAAVVDAFTDLNLAGTTTVAALDAGSGAITTTGTVTGGTLAGTLSTAAQPNITSVGTLTALTGGTGDLNWDSGTLFVDSSANSVGIGTTSPAGFLEINGGTGVATTGGTLIVRQDGDASTDGIALTSSNAISHRIWKDVNGKLNIGPSTLPSALVQDTSGNVGIGTDSPQGLIHSYQGASGQSSVNAFANGLVIEDNVSNGLSILTPSTTIGSIFFGDEADNFIGGFRYDHTDNSLATYVNNAERMRINSSGNVGIGTTSPSTVLHVKGDIGFKISDSASARHLNITPALSDGTPAIIESTSANGLRLNASGSGAEVQLYSNGSEAMRIDSSGNVGIGTTSPSSKLDSEETYDTVTNILANGTYAAKFGGDTSIGAAGRAQGIMIAGRNGTTRGAAILAENQNSGNAHDLLFATSSNASVPAERMRIDSSGNLLVGTTVTTPAQQSSVTGISLRTTGAIETAANASNAARFNRLTSDGSIVEFRKDGTTVGSIGVGSNQLIIDASASNLVLENSTRAIAFSSSAFAGSGSVNDAVIDLGISNRRFKDLYLSGTLTNNGTGGISIDTSGNVGIGTTSPDTKLHIDGGTASSLLKLDVDSGVAGNILFRKDNTRSTLLPEWTIQHKSNNEDFIIYGYDGTTFKNIIDYDWSATATKLFAGTTEAMRIDSSGKVGIGTSSPTKGKLVVTGAAYDEGILIERTDTSSRWGLSGNDSGSFQIWDDNQGDSTRLVIDSSGNVGIGTTSPSYKLEVNDAVKFDGQIRASTGSAAAPAYTFHADNTLGMFRNPNVLGFAVGGTERMRIDGSGNVGIGTSSTTLFGAAFRFVCTGTYGGVFKSTGGAGYEGLNVWNEATSGTMYQMYFRDGASGTARGSITTNGSTTAYNTSSDARLKEVTGEARGLEVINALNPVSYNWKESGMSDEGLLAQEVMEIVPNAIAEDNSGYYSMDYSKLVTPLIKAVQEQQVLIEQLQAEVALLKGE